MDCAANPFAQRAAGFAQGEAAGQADDFGASGGSMVDGHDAGTGTASFYYGDMGRKASAMLGSAVFLVIAPGFVAGLAPWWISHWRLEAPLFGMPVFRFAGGILIALGVIGLLDSFVRFTVQGLGTPAPVFPTRHLVVSGLYRYVRNPMYLAVVSTILGQGLLLGNLALLAYGALVWLLFHLFVTLYEEPTLRASFGSEYELFCSEVPRWIPRFTWLPG
jgi:protein-S-isoprenylcysteine O-methyltransferase Ste14